MYSSLFILPTIKNVVPAGLRVLGCILNRRSKPTVNKVSSLRDFAADKSIECFAIETKNQFDKVE